MSLEKAIKHGKEHRKEYYDSRRWDCSCRNHGSCSYCLSNRTIQSKRAAKKADLGEQADEYIDRCIGAGDPYDGEQSHWESVYRKMGIDPNDWDTLVELGELVKG